MIINRDVFCVVYTTNRHSVKILRKYRALRIKYFLLQINNVICVQRPSCGEFQALKIVIKLLIYLSI